MTMNTETEKVVGRLIDNLTPVKRLPSPTLRAAAWLALGIPYLALVVVVMSPRSNLAEKFSDAHFVIEQIAALVTGLTAAVAAFATIVPGYDRRIAWLPFAPLAVWLASLGEGCLKILATIGFHNFSSDWFCLPAIVLVGTVPAIAMAVMLRRGAPLTPKLTTAFGGLAAAGLGNFGLRLFHSQDSSLMILVWQMGSVLLLTFLCGVAGRFLLRWRLVNSRNAAA
jgi:hypothetical protein